MKKQGKGMDMVKMANIGRTSLVWAILCVVVGSVTAQTDPVLTLVKDGQSAAVIIVGQKASTAEQYAAEELQLYLEKISGAKVPVMIEGDQAKKATEIVIGTPKTNQYIAKSGLITDSSLGRDGLLIKTVDDKIILAGENPSGALYATYALLEEHLGCRWYFPGSKGEYVPAMKTITIGRIDDTQKPAIEFRGLHPVIHKTNDPEITIWMARNRMNYIDQSIKGPQDRRRYEDSIKRGFFRSTNTHFNHWLQRDKLFDTHPEYYPLLDGKRMKGYENKWYPEQLSQHNYCLSSRGAAKETAKAIKAFVELYPSIEIISVNQQDSVKWCQCEECKALGTPTDRLHTFLNRLVDELGPTLDGRFLATQAYLGTDRLPVKVKPNPKVIIFYAMISHCTRHGWDEGCPSQEKLKKNLAGWMKYGNKVVAYTYHTNCFTGFPLPLAFSSLSEMKYYNQVGVAGWFPEITPDLPGERPHSKHPYVIFGDDWYAKKLMYYTAAKALWNSNVTLDEIKDDFFPKFYGAAGPAMRKYYDTMEDAWRNPPEDVRYLHIRFLNYNPDMVIDFLNPTLISTIKGYLGDVGDLSENESDVVKGRVARDVEMFSKWEKRYEETDGVATKR